MNPTHPRRRRAVVLAAAATLLTGGVLASSTAGAASPAPKERAPKAVVAAAKQADRDQGHVRKETWPLALKREAQKQAALQRVVEGKKPFKGSGKTKEVPLSVEGKDRIFVIIAEFGDNRHPDFCDQVAVEGAPLPCPYPSDGTPQAYDGPQHNEIPEPDRTVDNSTLWQADYNQAHYTNMYFTRMREYYERQSSGRYTFDGDVTDWVRVPFNEARYGRDSFCDDIVCDNTWFLLRDAMAVWVRDQKAAGRTDQQIHDYLATFDIQDRYDIDGDEVFDEPDNFIDHFQIVHAGGDQAAGDPTYGSDAIWSHRWRAAISQHPNGIPGFEIGTGMSEGGQTLPENKTGVWVGDYTIQPENGGLGVFAHEYGHDLGLPDLYDTSGNTGGAENNTAFWTLMSSGANIGDGGPDGIGDAPTDMGVWELFQLGWLSAQGNVGPFYDVASAGAKSNHRLSANTPATRNGQQALFVLLPDNEVPLALGAPPEGGGAKVYWGGIGNNLNNTMTKVAALSGQLTAKVKYQIETDWDYAFLEAQVGGAWQPVATNLSDTAGDRSGFNGSKTGMTGTKADWTDLTATLPAGTTAVRFRYQTDGALALQGFRVDNIAVGGTVIGTAEDATAAAEAWALNGFIRTTGAESQFFFNAYVAENRQYDGYDTSLKTAYNFSYLLTKPDWVETYPYQNGLLVSYWNEEFEDNNVGDHPGGGLILPVDAHPGFSHWPDNHLMRNRILSYDSTFGLEPTDAITLHREVAGPNNTVITQTGTIASQPAVPTFDDTQTYWFNSDAHGATGAHPGRYQPGWYSVDVPKTGTTISVRDAGFRDGVMKVDVAPKG